ncbi:MAG: hypothetical protein ACR2JR_11135 [Rubrobacteraceae bacterium]
MSEEPDDVRRRSVTANNRGALVDWTTQRWVQATGQRVALDEYSWLERPVGDVDVIGTDFFARFADREGLTMVTDGPPRGLVENFAALAGPACSPSRVDARVVEFYEQTSEYEFDVWSEWRGGFRPFGSALAAIFSRRLQQLNVPLSPLDTSQGISTAVIQLVDAAGAVKHTAWVREIVASKRTLYAGSYSICRVPGFDGPCIKVAFPLPNGSANVIMRPESAPDGSFTVRSSGRSFGDPGFYFFVEAERGQGWARYLKALKEDIRVYVDPRGHLRADHNLRIWGATFLRLHYRMRRRVA